jgi:hypothetical protein
VASQGAQSPERTPFEHARAVVEPGEPAGVDLGRAPAPRGEHHGLVQLGRVRGRDAAVERRQHAGAGGPAPHRVEQGHPRGVALAVHGGELHVAERGRVGRARVRAERAGVEEVRARVALRGEHGGVAVGHDGRELVRVAEQHHARAAERAGRVAAVGAERPVDRVEQVGAQHRDLVDDERVDGRVERAARRVGGGPGVGRA